jgi:histidyl-tRNA synthetase
MSDTPTLVPALTPAGFRDYTPGEVAARQRMIRTIQRTYERFGFDPLETPAIEFMDTLLGPPSDTDEESAKMLFQARRLRGRDVAGGEDTEELGLRFDLTVPLARYVASHSGQLPRPFKRYQVGPVWRGERPQKGRFCEFLQFDLDTVGTQDLYADAEVLWGVHDALSDLGVTDFIIRVNNRKILNGLPAVAAFDPSKLVDVIRVIDKVDKVGADAVIDELCRADKGGLGLSAESGEAIRAFMNIGGAPDEALARVEALCGGQGVMAEGARELREIAAHLNAAGVPPTRWRIDLSIARGLGYYTGPVFETTLLDLPQIGSVCSGGRYDGLVSRFSSDAAPAVGASIGVDRLFAALKELGRLHTPPTCVEVLVTTMEKDRRADYIALVAELRAGGVNAALYQGDDQAFRAQMAEATRREVPVVLICGGRELRDGVVTLKDMRARTQTTVPRADLARAARALLG